MDKEASINLSAQERILKCFWSLYKENGMQKITVTKICSMAHINRSTFYSHFKDIYDVLDRIEEKVIVPLEFKNIVFDNLIMTKGKNMFLNEIVAFFDKNIEYMSVLLGKHGDPEFRNKLINRLSSSIIPMLNVSEENMSRVQLLFEYQNAAVISVIMKWYSSNNKLSKEELIKLLINVTTDGIQKELKMYMNN